MRKRIIQIEDPNRRSEERNAWIEYLATESDDSVLGPEEVDIHE